MGNLFDAVRWWQCLGGPTLAALRSAPAIFCLAVNLLTKAKRRGTLALHDHRSETGRQVKRLKRVGSSTRKLSSVENERNVGD